MVAACVQAKPTGRYCLGNDSYPARRDALPPPRDYSRVSWRGDKPVRTCDSQQMRNKVPQVTLAFWIIKIAATTLGETGGDALSMTLNLGYAVSTAIFFGFFLATASAQIAASKLYRFLYW